MNDEAVVERLTAVLRQLWAPDDPSDIDVADAAVEAALDLLPVVREIAAEELREAALYTSAAYKVFLHARADALTEPPDGPVR